MHLRVNLVVLLMSFTMGSASFAPAVAQSSGTVDIGDRAPDPTPQEMQTAKSYENRATYLANTVQRLSTAMAATEALIAAFDAAPGTSSSETAPAIQSWRTSWNTLLPVVPEGQALSLKDDEIGNYIKLTVTLSAQLSSLPAAARPASFRSQVSTALEKQGLIVDQMLAEHGILNRALRYYPMSTVAHQAPLGCDQIAHFSRDFRCFAKTANPGLAAGAWCDITDHAQIYSVAEWSAGTVMMVRIASFTDHILAGGLTGELVAGAHSAAALKPKC